MSKQVRIKDKAHDKLKLLARIEGRSMANMVERLVEADFTQRGFDKPIERSEAAKIWHNTKPYKDIREG